MFYASTFEVVCIFKLAPLLFDANKSTDEYGYSVLSGSKYSNSYKKTAPSVAKLNNCNMISHYR
jgi:hypothetical protein